MTETITNNCQRADTYKFLSECYYLPDEQLRQKVVDVAQTNQFFAELAGCIALETELEPLKIDYTQLFVGPFKLLAPPYGSVYLEDSRMMGDSTVNVKNWYEKEGLNIIINDAPDHIPMELEFMYYLVTKQIEATTEDANLQILQKQQSFLQVHLARWLPQFVKNVQENAQTEFYKKLAQLTETFIIKELNDSSLYSTQQSDLTGGC